MDVEIQQINDCQSVFVSVSGFYPHHVGYEIHSLSLEALEKQGGLGRAVQGAHTLNLEGNTIVSEEGYDSQPCDITFTDISTYDVNYDPDDDHAYIGSVRLSKSERIKATVNIKPSILRDVLNFFYNRPANDRYQLKRAVIVRLDISVDPCGEGHNQRYKIFRIALE